MAMIHHNNYHFALLTSQLLLLPTPVAVNDPSYRKLYARLHRDPAFCQMAFGDHFPAVEWSDERTREVIETRDINRSWRIRGVGDFAIGMCGEEQLENWKIAHTGQQLCVDGEYIHVVEGLEFVALMDCMAPMEWVGYAGVRDATTTSLRKRDDDEALLPPWEEMVEIRYGVSPDRWGRGIATGAAEAVMRWAASHRGVRRFIAETERANIRSGKVLKKMGFSLSGTNYWEEPSEVEWERRIQTEAK